MFRLDSCVLVLLVLALCLPGVALAGTKVQLSLTPDSAAADPGFSANGSSIRIDDLARVKGKIKGVVDGGMLVTTDPLDAGDDYYVEIDLKVKETGQNTIVTIFFDLKNGNGKFSADLSASAVFAGSIAGDGVEVEEVRVYSSNTQIGRAGFALR